ncbi:MAG: PQQ-dependent sugar dehydrogenase [Xanthomonadales bacterium]|nr:PQQ-dependent sugar dehydrogenase [Xanthomonadales bacterium]
MTQAGRLVGGAGLLLALALAGAGCRDPGAPPAAGPADPVVVAATPGATEASELGRFRVRELVRGLEHPWSLAFLPDGGLLVSERPGRLRRIDLAVGTVSAPIAGLPRMFVRGQGGLLDIALSPGFGDDHLVYFAWSEANWRGNKAGTTVSRARLDGDSLGPVEPVVRQEPRLSFGTHFGARLAFDDAGLLFVALGDNRVSASAQWLDHLQGKVLRLHPDGRVPEDNPFAGRDDARPEIWSYGHRNIQGMVLHPGTGALWTHEHGPRGGDEINLPVRGGNHGWPLATHGLEYSGAPVPEALATEPEGLVPPLHWWPESPAISGMAFHGGGVLPAWRGNLFVGALAGRALLRLVVEDGRVVHEERLLGGRGERIRDVREGSDGLLYLLTDEVEGRLLRLEPADD